MIGPAGPCAGAALLTHGPSATGLVGDKTSAGPATAWKRSGVTSSLLAELPRPACRRVATSGAHPALDDGERLPQGEDAARVLAGLRSATSGSVSSNARAWVTCSIASACG